MGRFCLLWLNAVDRVDLLWQIHVFSSCRQTLSLSSSAIYEKGKIWTFNVFYFPSLAIWHIAGMDHLGGFLQLSSYYALMPTNCKLQMFADNDCCAEILVWMSLALFIDVCLVQEWHTHITMFKHFVCSTSWKKVLLGNTVSERNEKKSLDLATKICLSLIEETRQALQKVFIWIINLP